MLNKLRSRIESMKIRMRYTIDLYKFQIPLVYINEIDEINNKGYIMKKSTCLLARRRAQFCLMQIQTFDGQNYFPCLYTDELYYELSKETQEFIIQHELGHFNLQKDILLNNVNIEGILRYDELEFEADEYAMNVVGREQAIKALEELKYLALKVNYGKINKHNRFGIEELDRRIYNLKACRMLVPVIKYL